MLRVISHLWQTCFLPVLLPLPLPACFLLLALASASFPSREREELLGSSSSSSSSLPFWPFFPLGGFILSSVTAVVCSEHRQHQQQQQRGLGLRLWEWSGDGSCSSAIVVVDVAPPSPSAYSDLSRLLAEMEGEEVGLDGIKNKMHVVKGGGHQAGKGATLTLFEAS